MGPNKSNQAKQNKSLIDCSSTVYKMQGHLALLFSNVMVLFNVFSALGDERVLCKDSRFGCCPDGVTVALGNNNEGCPNSCQVCITDKKCVVFYYLNCGLYKNLELDSVLLTLH